MRDRLIKERKRVAHGAFGGARDQRERCGLDLDYFLGRDPFEMLDEQAGVDAPQIEALAARQDGDRDLADFGGGKNELGVRRRLFQRLEQRVERLRREHVHFVEDVDLVARPHRRVADRVVDLAHVVDAVMRGGVHLDHVDMPALHDRLAVHADDRHLDRRARYRTIGQLVVERARQDAGRGGLADAAHAGEDPGLRDAAGLERVRDGAHHGVLADQVVEAGGAIFAREHAVAVHVWRLILNRNTGLRRLDLDTYTFRCGLLGVTHKSIRSAGPDAVPDMRMERVGG